MAKNNRLFKIYAQDFGITLKKCGLKLSVNDKEITEPLYVCPLTLRCYSEHALATGLLSLEHVPPKSLGGKGIVLTERAVNNTDGSTSDKKMLNFFEGLNFKYKGGEIGTSITVGEDKTGRIGAKMSLDTFKGRPRIKFITKKSNIEALDYKGLFENWNGGKFHIKGTLQQKIDEKALLKSAYLTAFSKIGYDLIFGKKGFRSNTYGQLINYLNGTGKVLDFPFAYINDHAPIDGWSVGLVTFPQNLSNLVINLTFQLKGTAFKYAVFLPNPDHDDLDNLMRLQEKMPLHKSKLNFQVGALPFDISERKGK